MPARRKRNKPQPQLNRQLETVEQKPAKEKNMVAIELGKFLLDLAKLIFGGMFLTAIMDLTADRERIIYVCVLVILLLAVMGLIFIRYGNNKKQ